MENGFSVPHPKRHVSTAITLLRAFLPDTDQPQSKLWLTTTAEICFDHHSNCLKQEHPRTISRMIRPIVLGHLLHTSVKFGQHLSLPPAQWQFE